MHSESITNIATALSLAQGEMRGAIKDSENPHLHSKYADLASCWNAIREPLARNGLAVVQLPRTEGSSMIVQTLLMHKTGEWISSEITLTAVQATPQGLGSALTYGRRYGLSAMIGIAPEDDDGEAASQPSRASGVAAAGAIAEKKLEKLKAARNTITPPPSQDAQDAQPSDLEKKLEDSLRMQEAGDSVDFKAMMQNFKELKEKCIAEGAEAQYYDELHIWGYAHSNQIRPLTDARKIYRAIAKRLVAVKAGASSTGIGLVG